MRVFGLLAIFVAASACIEPSLQPCGELLCGGNARCLDGRCVPTEQLEACDGRADGDACMAFEATGSCNAGVCQIIQCGNAVIDPGELCDDGNTVDGDTCRRDCLSDLTCGNGILDPAERCDCGRDEATRPGGCPVVNDDATTALCDTQCQRYCGDGSVTGPEACDGTVVSATCTDFGFYTGSVSCTPFCTLAPSCTGTCGDGVVQEAEGELCDGAPPDASCTEFGRDYGVLGCNAFCNPDITGDCGSFGASKLVEYPSNQVELTGAAANARGFILWDDDNSELHLRWDTVETSRDVASAMKVAATTNALIAFDATQTLRYDDAGWSTLPALGATSGVFAEGTDLYTISVDCAIQRLAVSATPALVSLSTPPLTNCLGLAVREGVIAAWSDTTVAFQTGATWDTIDNISPRQGGWLDGDHLLINSNGSLIQYELTTGASTAVGAVLAADIAIASDGTAVVVRPAGSPHLVAGLFDIDTLQLPAVASPGYKLPVRTAEGRLMLLSPSALVAVNPAWLRTGATNTVAVTDRIGGFGVCTATQLRWTSSTGRSTIRNVPAACGSVIGSVEAEHYIGTRDGRVLRYDPSISTYVQEYSGVQVSHHLHAPAGEPWLYDFASLRRRITGTWTLVAPPATCGSLRSAASTATTMYALYDCGGVITLHAWNNGWTAVATARQSSFVLVTALDESVFVGGLDHVMRLDTDVLTALPIPPGFSVSRGAARARDDVYMVVGNELYHWNGSRLEHISTVEALNALSVIPNGLLALMGTDFVVLPWIGPRPTGL